MAEGIMFDIAGSVLSGLGSLAMNELNLAKNAKAELNKLKGTISTIKAVLLDAEERQNNNNNNSHEIKLWLGRLKDVVYDVDDFLDDLSTNALVRKAMKGNGMTKEVRIFFSKSNQPAYRFKMGHRVQDLREVLDCIAVDSQQFGFTNRREVSQSTITETEPTHSFVVTEEVIGRDGDKEAIVNLLLANPDQESIGVIPIVGIGGLGKTTLAQMVFNDEKVKAQFELKMWVCVSDRFEVGIVVEKILEAAIKKKPEKCELDTLQSQLRDEIDGKRYFLVLDDVWNEDVEKWSMVKSLLLGGAKGSRIVVTTRSEKIGEITRTNGSEIYPLKGLVKDKSLSLFEKIAFENQTQTPTQKDLLGTFGEEIVRVCAGVPLAIRAIGSVLRFKRTKLEWSIVLESMPQTGTGIEPILKRSYDHLPSHLKHCFAYCSLFPKDYEINKHALINLWMAQGFIRPLTKGQSLEDAGHDYFMDLLWRSFFQEAKVDDLGNIERCKMHDLMHDLAKFVAETECSLITNPYVENVENTRHVSLGEEFDSSWEIPSALLEANKMRTFFQVALELNESNCNAIAKSFRCLRMLDFKRSVFEKLPHPICKLKHLRYLDLSRNNKLRKLPNCVTRLYNLQTLDLRYCSNFEEWPGEIRKLVSLRHLYIEGCDSLRYMPRGMGELTCLTTLDRFIVGRRIDSGGLSELMGLNNLRGRLVIMRLENANIIPEMGATYLKDKLYLDSLILEWRYYWGEEVDGEKVLESLGPHPNLEKLEVWGYRGAKFSNWLSSITSLVKVELRECRKCRNLPPMDQLPALKFLRLVDLADLEYVSETKTEITSTTTVKFFPSLESLEINFCLKLKGWWKENGDEDEDEATTTTTSETEELLPLPCFPRLSSLVIRNCPKLISFPLFPNLTGSLELYNASGRLLKQTISMRNKSSSALPLSNLKSLFLSRIQDVDMDSMLEELLLLNCRWDRLESLEIDYCPGLTMLPKEVNANTLTSLHKLKISSCANLMALPNWIPNLTSLQELRVRNCPKLPSLPQGMSRLTNLQSLQILDCGPQLKERYQRDTGAHWAQISHIAQISFDY